MLKSDVESTPALRSELKTWTTPLLIQEPLHLTEANFNVGGSDGMFFS